MAEHVTNLYLHEIALHQNQGSADLQPPYTTDAISPSVIIAAKKDGPVGPAHIGALGDCLTATHGILDTILSIELDILLTLPVIFCKFLTHFPCSVLTNPRCPGNLRHRLPDEDVGVGDELWRSREHHQEGRS